MAGRYNEIIAEFLYKYRKIAIPLACSGVVAAFVFGNMHMRNLYNEFRDLADSNMDGYLDNTERMAVYDSLDRLILVDGDVTGLMNDYIEFRENQEREETGK